jgi:hypothetical protein
MTPANLSPLDFCGISLHSHIAPVELSFDSVVTQTTLHVVIQQAPD